jgi:enterochelin esterase family protein
MNSRPFRRGMVVAMSSFLVLLAANACGPQADRGPMSPGSGGKSGTSSGGNTGSGGSPPSTGGSGVTGTGGATDGSGGSGSGGSVGTGGTGSGGTGAAGVGTGGRAAGSGGSGTTGSGGAGGRTSGGPGGDTGAGAAGTTGAAGQAGTGLPDPGNDGDGDSMVGPNYTSQSDLTSKGNPRGKTFSFSVTSKIFDGKDTTLTKTPVSVTRTIQAYVPAMYKDGAPAPVLIIQDGPGPLTQVSNALDNLTISTDPLRKLPPFIVIAVPPGGNDSIGSERGLEYDTLSDRYARYITQEIMPALQTSAKATYPSLKFDPNASGRAALGCSSGGAAAFTMAWFRPDLFSRVIAYSATLVAQQDPKAPESTMYPHGAWDYHSDLELIKNDKMGRDKLLRIFHNANEMDMGASDAASGRHNWLMAGMRTAAALKAKGFHYKYVEGLGAGHCAGQVQSATLADALIWVWRGYQAPVM